MTYKHYWQLAYGSSTIANTETKLIQAALVIMAQVAVVQLRSYMLACSKLNAEC